MDVADLDPFVAQFVQHDQKCPGRHQMDHAISDDFDHDSEALMPIGRRRAAAPL